MITFYTGTPGSGKSYSMAYKIRLSLLRGKNVISTVDIDTNVISKNGRKKIGNFHFVPINELTADYLYKYFSKHHPEPKESQTIVFIDECQLIFNTRTWQAQGRMEWIEFFTRHRHLGFDIVLITQNDQMIDKQIRGVVENEFKHTKLNNLFLLLPITLFYRREYWYGLKDKKPVSRQTIPFRKKIANIYNSLVMYHEFREIYAENEPTSQGNDAPCDSGAGGGVGLAGLQG